MGNMIDANSESFFKLALNLGANLPFKRTLSLMRLLECDKYVWEKSEWNKECDPSICGTRYQSCKDYDSNIKYYDRKLDRKICNRFIFFKTTNGIQELLGYCIVHEDDLIRDGESSIKKHYYLTECVLSDPPRKIKGYAYGNYETAVPYNGKKISIKGNYFSQQNNYTNCCAQAAIKMVLRGYFKDITCEGINKSVGISHENREGRSGFRAKQTCDAIESYSKAKSNCALEPSMIVSDSADPGLFLKSVYHAIESKIPVILFMILPKGSASEQTKGHAVSLVGHSFETNNWSAYGGGYFSEKDVGYLSSFLWCGSFIIQDDNFGPFYQLTTKFLREYTDLCRRMMSFSDCAMKRSPLKADASTQPPLSAVLVHKADHFYIRHSCLIEIYAAFLINHFVNELQVKDQLPENDEFDLYFYNYINNVSRSGVSNNKNGHQKALILRTIIVSRKEYIESEVGDLLKDNNLRDLVEYVLPDYFWLIEISVPELFWVNKRKVGEIIIDPIIFQSAIAGDDEESVDESPILIRLPSILSIYQEVRKDEGKYGYLDYELESSKSVFVKQVVA
jgi:hypothetical protein